MRPLNPRQLTKRTRALDVGAGIGRVTSSVLLHLVHDVVLLEPVDHFVSEAFRRVSASEHIKGEWKGIKENQKSVTIVQGTLQDFDPSTPLDNSGKHLVLGRVGYSPAKEDSESGYDVVWCQWCMGHLSDDDLIAFLIRAKKSLRSASDGSGDLDGLIVVKENICEEHTPGVPRTVFDDQDSSLTRYVWVIAYSLIPRPCSHVRK